MIFLKMANLKAISSSTTLTHWHLRDVVEILKAWLRIKFMHTGKIATEHIALFDNVGSGNVLLSLGKMHCLAEPMLVQIQFGSNSTIFRAAWPWNLADDLQK